MAKLIRDENLVFGLPPSDRSQFLAGVTNYDPGATTETNIGIPWPVKNRPVTYLDYAIWIEVLLDAGMAVHRILPQTVQPIDTLATTFVGDFTVDESILEINTVSQGRFTDVVQRMAHSIYKFALKGMGLRAGYTIPIPGLKTVCGVPAIPDERQFAYSRIVGNWSGVPIWMAEWDLRYLVALPPRSSQETPPNLALHVRGKQDFPKQMQVPYSPPDSNSRTATSGN